MKEAVLRGGLFLLGTGDAARRGTWFVVVVVVGDARGCAARDEVGGRMN